MQDECADHTTSGGIGQSAFWAGPAAVGVGADYIHCLLSFLYEITVWICVEMNKTTKNLLENLVENIQSVWKK